MISAETGSARRFIPKRHRFASTWREIPSVCISLCAFDDDVAKDSIHATVASAPIALYTPRSAIAAVLTASTRRAVCSGRLEVIARRSVGGALLRRPLQRRSWRIHGRRT